MWDGGTNKGERYCWVGKMDENEFVFLLYFPPSIWNTQTFTLHKYTQTNYSVYNHYKWIVKVVTEIQTLTSRKRREILPNYKISTIDILSKQQSYTQSPIASNGGRTFLSYFVLRTFQQKMSKFTRTFRKIYNTIHLLEQIYLVN